MEKELVVEVLYDGKKDIEGFAMSILYLTNLKSSVPESVIDIETFEGNNHISVVMYKEFYDKGKEALEEKIGKQIHISYQEMFGVTYDDIDKKIMDEMDNQTDKWLNDDTEKTLEPCIYLIK